MSNQVSYIYALHYDIIIKKWTGNGNLEIHTGGEDMPDTIFYQGKLKRGKDPLDVFEKITKGIKKKGPTKDWSYTIDEERECLRIDFPDGKSESFVLEFNDKGEFQNFCKVYFPLEGEPFEDGKSEFKALLDALYKAKSMYRTIEITDDYGLAESYWDSKRFKFDLRQLSEEEDARVRRLYAAGNTTPEQMLRAVMAEDMGMTAGELRNYVNIDICYDEMEDSFGTVAQTLETYLYETAAFQKEGRLCEVPDLQYYDLGKISFSVFAFIMGMSLVFLDGTGMGTTIHLEKLRSFSQKDAQVGLLFREKFAPLFLEQTDPLERCILVYRYFVSVFEYLGFVFVGRAENLKTIMDQILEEYGEEKGTVYLTCYCTSEKYIFKNFDTNQREIYKNSLIINLAERYGKHFFKEYVTEFKRKYEGNMKFRQEVKYMVRTGLKYMDDSLVHYEI